MSRVKSQDRCATCITWQPGNSWMTNARGVYADGTCKKTGKHCANVHHACRFYEKKPHMGVIIHMDAEAAYNALNGILHKIQKGEK